MNKYFKKIKQKLEYTQRDLSQKESQITQSEEKLNNSKSSY
jgi:putative cell wall-binding protein